MKALRTLLARAYRSLSAGRRRRRAVDVLSKSGLVDPAFYGSRIGVAFDSPTEAAEHFLRTPIEDPHPLFSTAFYLSRAPDVAASGKNPLLHFIENGAAELRQPHPLFDLAAYVARHGDEPGVRADPLRHYLETGWRLGFRAHPVFDERWYLDTYPDVAAQGVQPLLHFLTRGRAEGRDPSRHFDTGWYLARYPDVDTRSETALQHYLTTGAREQRDPSGAFDTAWYVGAYPDVAESGKNPLVHFVEHGFAGGYVAMPLVALDARFGLPTTRFHVWRSRRAADWTAERLQGAARLRIPALPRHAEESREAARLEALTRHACFETPAPQAPQHDGGGGRTPSPPGLSEATPPDRGIVVLAVPRHDRADAADRTRASVMEAGAALGLDPVTLAWGDKAFSTLDRTAPDTMALVLEAGDVIDATGLAALVATFSSRVRLCVFDTYHAAGDETFPVLQPGANPGHLRSIDSTFSRFAMRADLMNAVVSRSGRGQAARETLLAALDLVSPDLASGELAHCPLPVVETRDLQADIRRMRQEVIRSGGTASSRRAERRSISVVICTKDKGHLLGQLLQHLTRDGGSGIVEITVVSNGTTNPFALRTLAKWRSHPLLRIVDYDRRFNFSEQCNLGASDGRGELLLFLNDDIVPTEPDWLARLSGPLDDPGVGIAGPLLLYPDETVQHAGMFTGYRGGAGHVLRHARLPDGDYLFLSTAIRDVSCVTGAALLIRRSLFSELGGFDTRLPSIYQDVDLCLRARRRGRRILFVPEAVALHMESASIKEMLDAPGVAARRDAEFAHFASRHREELSGNDPFLNPSFSLADEGLRSLRG